MLLNAKSGQLSFFSEEQECNEGEYDIRYIPSRDKRKRNFEPEVVDSTDCKVTDMKQPLETEYKNDDLQFPTHVFERIIPEWVGNLLGYVNGMKIFKVLNLIDAIIMTNIFFFQYQYNLTEKNGTRWDSNPCLSQELTGNE